MAIDMISEVSSLVTSPRISFSDDLCNDDTNASAAAIDQEFPYGIESSSEFDFCISNSTNTETSSADELFLDGLIRPIQLQEKFVTLKLQVPLSKTQSVASKDSSDDQEMKQEVSTTIVVEQKNQAKSFWHIKRSSSLHCVNNHKKSSFWSLPLLSRSNSTGSVPNAKQSTKEGVKQNAQLKQLKSPSQQKPPLRKNYYGGPGLNYGNGVRINPVLNVPPPTFISKGTANLFGLGSFFANGKDKKSKK